MFFLVKVFPVVLSLWFLQLLALVDPLVVVQVHLAPEPYVYSRTFTEPEGEAINKNLFFDLSHSHLYVTSHKKVLGLD